MFSNPYVTSAFSSKTSHTSNESSKSKWYDHGKKQVWTHLIKINRYICIRFCIRFVLDLDFTLDFVVSRGKSSKKIRSSPAKGFLGKVFWNVCICFEHFFLRTSIKGCFWKRNKIVSKLFYHLESVTLHSINLIFSR